jgi:hypothetical protein
MKTMMWQEVDDEHEVDFAYINDLDIDSADYKESRDVLYDSYPERVHVAATEDRPSGMEYGVSEITHNWNQPTFEWLGQLKQRYLDHAREEGYDAVFLVDSDLLMDPKTLHSLISVEQPIVSAVFWTRWQPDAPELPQVWQQHPYGLDGGMFREPEFLNRLSKHELLEVRGLGACTLIRLDGTEEAMYYPFLDDLPSGGMWQGEDRHFCVRANRAHIPLYADAWPRIKHVYRPSDATSIDEWLAELNAPRPPVPTVGNLVSVKLCPMEIAGWDGFAHIRGRIGGIKWLPDLEGRCLQQRVGEKSIVSVNFPLWWPVEQLRGDTKMVMMEVVDARYYSAGPDPAEDRYYTPAQLAVMRKAEVYESDIPRQAAVRSKGDDVVPGDDIPEDFPVEGTALHSRHGDEARDDPSDADEEGWVLPNGTEVRVQSEEEVGE